MSLPITFKNLCNLSQLGISDECFRVGNLVMESDKWICVKEDLESGSHVTLIDMEQNFAVNRRSMKADAAMMNPVHNILVLKAKQEGNTDQHFVQVFNLGTKNKMGTHSFNEKVEFWKWVTPTVLGLVTSSSVNHWEIDLDKDSVINTPRKIFDRSADLTGKVQIIN